MNDINFLLIKMIKWKIFLRPLNIFIAFFPIFLDISNNFIFYWCLSWIIIFLLNVNFIKPYKPIGKLIMNPNKIELIFNNQSSLIFDLKESIDINIDYNGYKGGHEDYNILQLPLSTKDGIGYIKIKKNDDIYEYKYVALDECKKRLNIISNIVRNNGGTFELHT